MAPQDTVTVARETPTREDMLERAEEIAPRLRARAGACEAARMVPIETIDDYKRTGLVRMSMPARYSGFELVWDVLCEVTQILAAACGSQAWIQRICADHAMMVGTFEAQAQDDVWGDDHDTFVSAAFDPVGRARKVDGGYIFSGRHGFSSGIDHSDWMICGGFIQDGETLDGPPFFLVPKCDAVVIDDWHVTGFAALNVGMARGILHDWYAFTRPRKSRGIPIAKDAGTQILATRSHAEIDAAEALYLNNLRDAMARLERHEILDPLYIATARRNVAFACQLALKAATRLINSGGGGLLFDDNPIQRQYRNLLGGVAHHGVNWERAAQGFGAVVLDEGAG